MINDSHPNNSGAVKYPPLERTMAENIDVFQQIQETYGIAPSEILSVRVLSKNIKQILATHPSFNSVLVLGEVTDFNKASSGHIYFSLKEEKSEIACILFKSMQRDVDFDFDNGLQVLVKGELTTYEPRSRYQINIRQILPIGEGLSLLKRKRLKEKLAKEGLFEDTRKKIIPILPRKIGIITSKNGAAIEDILNVVESRFPKMSIVIAPVKVQGEDASEDIIRGLKHLSKIDEVDTIILARGGGSAEELSVFNDEALVRAISSSNKPIVTGIGHEKDITLADLVADLRASTPSTAAKIAVSDVEKLKDELNSFKRHLERSYRAYLASLEADKKDVEIRKKDVRLSQISQDMMKRDIKIVKYRVITIIMIFIIILILILIIIW